MSSLNASINTSQKIIPFLDIEDHLTFKDYLFELNVQWASLVTDQKINHVMDYLAEESNADFFVDKATDSNIEITCDRLVDKKHLNLGSLDALTAQIFDILDNLTGCTA